MESQKLAENCSFYQGLSFVLPGKDTVCHGMGCTVIGAVIEMNSTRGFTIADGSNTNCSFLVVIICESVLCAQQGLKPGMVLPFCSVSFYSGS